MCSSDLETVKAEAVPVKAARTRRKAESVPAPAQEDAVVVKTRKPRAKKEAPAEAAPAASVKTRKPRAKKDPAAPAAEKKVPSRRKKAPSAAE